jgi:hypothetical protein
MSEKVIASLLFLAWVFWMIRLWQKWQDERDQRRVDEYKIEQERKQWEAMRARLAEEDRQRG